MSVQERAIALADTARVLIAQTNERVIGQEAVVEDLVVGILAGGHLLLEGVPGLGKTLLVKTIAAGLGLEHSRVQFTPDLMPADVTGTQVFEERDGTRRFRFQRGPLFAGLVLADEINRATPKTQSALLEAMQESSVTVAGETHRLPEPFHVVATQNPIELEGTFPLPEAQLDRFAFKLVIEPPSVEAMVQILAETTGTRPEPLAPKMTAADLLEFQRLVREVLVHDGLIQFVAKLLQATLPAATDSTEDTRRLVRFGASARAGQAILLGAKARALLDGRPHVMRSDVESTLAPSLRHRVVLRFEADAEGVSVDDLIPGWVRTADRP